MDWIFDGLLTVLLGWMPGWVWIVVAGVALGWAWKVFGWQGVVGGLLAVLTLGAYRQGWRARDGQSVIGKRHDVNRDDVVVGRAVDDPPPPKKRRTLMDILGR